jgi:catechol 2,3-dioxygenase-like lactoylglutathione lyase family enzyme
MRGGIDHLMINASSFDAAVRFYSWLMPNLGYPNVENYDQPERMIGFWGDFGSLWVMRARNQNENFDKTRIGLREVAFRVPRRAQIDELAREISSRGGRILDPPREYDYRPGYYAVFFTDPDGIKLEIVNYPD